MNLRAFVPAFLVAAAAIFSPLCLAQDDKPENAQTEEGKAEETKSEDGDSPAAKFTAARTNFEKLQKQLRALVQEFQTAKKEDRESIREKYTELAAEAHKLLETVRTTGVAAYKAEPNKDEMLTTTLVGLLANDVSRDDYKSAQEIVQLLIDNKAEHNLLYNYAGIMAYSTDRFSDADKWLRTAAESGTLTQPGERDLEDAVAAQERYERELKLREAEAKADDLPRVKIETAHGAMVIELFENEAPETVGNFVSLVEKGFYDGLSFHRVLANFMAQGGDPKGDGTGGPGYKIYCECAKPEHREHFRGTLSMAHAGKDTGGSQFFITFRPTPQLDGKHTAFGRVIEGLEVLAKIQRRDPQAEGQPEPDKIVKAEVVRKRDHEYKPNKVE